MTGVAPGASPAAAFSRSEMMIVAAARELAGFCWAVATTD